MFQPPLVTVRNCEYTNRSLGAMSNGTLTALFQTVPLHSGCQTPSDWSHHDWDRKGELVGTEDNRVRHD